MTTIKRYELRDDRLHMQPSLDLFESTTGGYVKWEDHEAVVSMLERTIRRLRKRIDAYRCINVGEAVKEWMEGDMSRPLIDRLADMHMDTLQDAVVVPRATIDKGESGGI